MKEFCDSVATEYALPQAEVHLQDLWLKRGNSILSFLTDRAGGGQLAVLHIMGHP